eukprot:1991303-Pyramimonas_sp.AAC.1
MPPVTPFEGTTTSERTSETPRTASGAHHVELKWKQTQQAAGIPPRSGSHVKPGTMAERGTLSKRGSAEQRQEQHQAYEPTPERHCANHHEQ